MYTYSIDEIMNFGGNFKDINRSINNTSKIKTDEVITISTIGYLAFRRISYNSSTSLSVNAFFFTNVFIIMLTEP